MLLGVVVGLIVGYVVGSVLRSLGVVCVVLCNPPLAALVFGVAGLLVGHYVSRRAEAHIRMPNLAPLETAEQYQEKVTSVRKPMVIEFYADWCGACKRVGPVLNELAKEYGDRIYFYRVDIDKAGALAQQNSVDGVPTAIFYARGSEVKRIAGMAWRNELQQELDSLLGG